MAIRTHKVLAALGEPQRLDVLLAVLEAREVRLWDLASGLGISENNAGRYVTRLRDAGLLERGRTQRTAIYVPRPRETRALIRAAALIDHEHTGNPDALELAADMLRQDMALGAGEPSPPIQPRPAGEPSASADNDGDAS